MSLSKVFETPDSVRPSLIVYRTKPSHFFVQFTEEGKSINDFTVTEILLKNDDLHMVHDYERNIDKPPTRDQIEAFAVVREWLQSTEE